MKKSKFNNEIIQFLSLLILTTIVLYYTPSIVQTVYFFSLLFLFWKSKKDYFWLAFTFVIVKDIGGIFYEQTLNILKVGPLELSFLFLFTIVAFVKQFGKHKKINFLLRKPFKVYLFYLFFLMYLGFLIYGNDGGGKSGLRYYFTTSFFLIYMLNIYSVPRILDSMQKVELFAKLIFVCLFINLLGQIFHITNGAPFYAKFGQVVVDRPDINYMDKLVRPVWGHTIIFLGIISAMFFYLTKNKTFKNNYLLVIILVSLVSVFIGATRGWIIALTSLLLGFLFLNKINKSISILIFSTAFFAILFSTSSIVRIQSTKVFDRLTTLEKLVGGDATAGGTNLRLTTRHNKVMNVFYKYPVFGGGFSTEAMKKNDMHVGNQNILMSGGIIGYLIIVYFWMYYIYKVLIIRKKLSINNKYRSGLYFMIVILFATILIHSSSTSLYGYLAYIRGKIFIIAILFTILNQFLLSAIEYEQKVISKKQL